MRLRTKLALSALTMAAAILVSVAVTLLGVWRADYNQMRTVVAYMELTSYLQIAQDSRHVFDRARSDLLTDGVLSFDLDEAERRIGGLVADASAITAAEGEADLDDEEEQLDPARVSALGEEIAAIFQRLRTAQRLCGERHGPACRAAIDPLYRDRVDGRLSEILRSGLTGEWAEADAAVARQRRVEQIVIWAAVATGAAALAATISSLLLARKIRRRLCQLEAGADAFATGRLGHRIEADGDDELAALAKRFNIMAEQLGEQGQAREEIRAELERAVVERTAELREANAALRRRDATRRSFFADIGHELRTPITALRGEAEVALRSRGDKEAAYGAALSRIVELSAQLTRFVEDIFLIARAEAGVLDMRSGPVDLAWAVETALEQIGAVAALHDAQTSFVAPERPALISGDAQRLRQLAQLLIGNAFTHGPAGVRVGVSVTRDGEAWRLSVVDDGPGLDREEMELMFERFHRGSEGARKPGSGLGLPIARSISIAHGGAIWMEKDAGGGLAVHATFPALVKEAGEAQPPEPATAK